MPTKASPQFSVEDVLDFISRLPAVRMGDGYSEIDRARDFIAVFAGESDKERGMRVLAQISDFCSPIPSPRDADKPGTLAFKEGQRFVIAEIMRAFTVRSRVPEHIGTERNKNARRTAESES